MQILKTYFLSKHAARCHALGTPKQVPNSRPQPSFNTAGEISRAHSCTHTRDSYTVSMRMRQEVPKEFRAETGNQHKIGHLLS